MNWLSWIPNLLNSGKGLAEVFHENEEAAGQRKHAETLANTEIDKAVLQQFAAEFHNRNGRTWWDSLWDGLNRAPRPVIVSLIMYLLVLAVVDPLRFSSIASALALVPEGMWQVFGVICGFYFAGRMQVHSQNMKIKRDAVAAAQQLVAMRRHQSSTASNPATAEHISAPSGRGLEGIINGVRAVLQRRGTDKHGSGYFGAPRGDHTHEGIDYACPPGTLICAPIGGRVTKLGIAYGDDHTWRYVEIEQPLTKRRARIFYVRPSCKEGHIVRAGEVIGTSQSLDRRYPGITEHVHFELLSPDGTPIDPTELF